MIIAAIVLGIIIGNLCVDSANMVNATEHLNIFYVVCIGLLIISTAYFSKSARLSIKSIAKSSKRFKILLIAVAFIFTVIGLINFSKIIDIDPSTFTLISSGGMLASGFSLLFVIVLTNRGKFQNQLAASISTIPILWLVFELIVIFKDNLSNPYISEYILAIFLYISTALAIYYFSSAFCVADKTNRFKEFYVVSIFVCVVYAVANKAGYVSSEGILVSSMLRACGLLNLFMLPFYITGIPLAKKLTSMKTTVSADTSEVTTSDFSTETPAE